MTRERVIDEVGDAAVRWTRDPERDARALLDALRAHPRVIDAIVTEEHALVTFDPEAAPEAPWRVEDALPRGVERRAAREHVVRAQYDGPDLDEVAAHGRITREGVIRLHAAQAYVVRFVGFLPGFAYLGPVAPELALPRRATPRTRVEAGSIAIAAGYTGIYPFASPGGWHLIGRAIDFAPFDPARGALLGLGDRVRFEAT